jgi:hypothetical protein
LNPATDLPSAFRAHAVPVEGDPFAELSASVRFEAVGTGRLGAVLTRADEERGAPLVRTTTRYAAPAQGFRAAHDRLARQICAAASLAVDFNNALIEIYTNDYTTMGAHSDQALDLATDSFVAVFSCYERPVAGRAPRVLLVESKEPGGGSAALPLHHNSAVVFSVSANARFKHKIVLSGAAGAENRWLGVTFRTSKTFVHYRDGGAHFADGPRLVLADEEQKREFFRLRRRENAETDFAYPRLLYTISESDLLPPERG